MNSNLINTKLGIIEYSLIGKGIPIIFIHGGHSNCNETLCHKGFDLENFQLITPSRPGYGRTPLAENKTPKQVADLILELLDYLSLENVIIYGISAGGLTAIELASNYPDRVSKLILASAVSKKWLEKDGKTYKIAQKIFHPKIEEFIWRIVKFFSNIFPILIGKYFYPQFSKNARHLLKKSDIEELVSSLQFYRSKMGFLNDIEQNIGSESLMRIKCPTLIIHSENDNIVSIEHAKYSNRMIANSKLEVLHNEWGHIIWIGNDSKESIDKTLYFIEN